MSIYAMSDLHLSKAVPDKTMDVFGAVWEGYEEKIGKNWKKVVQEEDTVIVPGDISWAIDLDEAYLDFKFLNDLPGTKIILRGNHDYYFSTKTKVEKFLKENNFDKIKILFNNSYFVEGYNICGTRGWKKSLDNTKEDNKVFIRELGRLKLSLDSIKEKNTNMPIIVAVHYPPFEYEVKQILKKYTVKKCIYGHLHGDGHYMVKEGLIDDIEYIMVGADYKAFTPVKLI